jgi:kumamolisin
MTPSAQFRPLSGSEHPHPQDRRMLHSTDPSAELTFTVFLRRASGHQPLNPLDVRACPEERPDRQAFVAARGADQREMDTVAQFLRDAGMEVLDADTARRSIVARGTVAATNRLFATELNDYAYSKGTYRSHDGAVNLPAAIADYVSAVVGLTNRKVEARHWRAATAEVQTAPGVPPNTVPLTPAQIATLYGFPAGDGAGETIALYEMETQDGPAGYSMADIEATMKALGNLPLPTIVDVPVDGTTNSGKSDGETGLDITVAGAIAPKSTIAVYFAAAQTQSMLLALQMMVTPKAGDPAPGIVSISYGWGADDPDEQSFSDNEYDEFTKIFEDAAASKITVLVSSGDSGAYVESKTLAQTSYPASDIWVTACGGTIVGNVEGTSCEEWVWNNGAAGGATGGGVSARFAVPQYQQQSNVPERLSTGQSGRGVPDIAGNASPYSGYLQVVNGSQPEPIGGTSAVAPLYAGLMARINANLGNPVGYLNTTLYTLSASAFRDIVGAPGPVNNSFEGVTGYPAGPGWDACTGLGSVQAEALQQEIAKA